MFSVAKDSFAMPHPVSGLEIPASVYITVSRSGQMCSPQRSKSSAVFTTREIPRREHVLQSRRELRPADPTGERADLHRALGMEHAILAGRDIVTTGALECVGSEGEDAEGVGYPAVRSHGEGLAQGNAAHADDLRPFWLLFSGHEVCGEEPHGVLVGDGVGEVSLPEHPPVPGLEACLLPELALGCAQGFFVRGAAALRYLPRVA